MSNPDFTQAELKREVRLNPQTGYFYWVLRGRGRRVGVPAGSVTREGYRTLRIFGRYGVQAHRLVWLWMYGEWPSQEVDHINGNKDDNRPENLRLVSREDNQQNRRTALANNSSGLLGCHTVKPGDYRSSIVAYGKKYDLGRFKTPEAAHEAYLVAKRKLHGGCTI
jgi:hypothetical protein